MYIMLNASGHFKRRVKTAGFVHIKKLLAHKFDPFPAVTLREFCRYPAHDFTQHTPRRHHCGRFVTLVFNSVDFSLFLTDVPQL
ncbi:TPA: hypothetical protein NNU28_001612 [Salmonella enterica]|nr:hypothetical protein [Salmonella enterica]